MRRRSRRSPRHLVCAAVWFGLAASAEGFAGDEAPACPDDAPGVAWKVEFTVPSASFEAHSEDPAGLAARVAGEALQAAPPGDDDDDGGDVGIDVDVRRAVAGQLSATAAVAGGRVQLQATSESTLTLVRVDVLACNSTAAVEGPAGVYRRAAGLGVALGAASMRWSAKALNLHGVPEEEIAALTEIDESQGNLLALAEYYGMMGDISEEKSLVASETTAFSKASVWQFDSGTRLVLGGIVMSDTRDEHIYHEMLVQPALLATVTPSKVLIVGGGEGAALREVLKDPRVQNVTMVEIDEGLVDLCRAHLSTMHRGSFDSPKVSVSFEDGAVFLRRAAPASFDVVVIDGVDFQEDQSYGNVLFARAFYQDVFNALRPGGVLAQYMSHVERSDEMEAVGFNDTVSFTVDVPSFFGAGARFTVAGKGVPEPLVGRIVRRVQHRADAGALQDWAYLRPKTLGNSLHHGGRRMKGVFGGGGPGYGHWGRSGYVGYGAFPSHLDYAAFVVLHTRRRRGVWVDNTNDGCTYSPMVAADGGGPTSLCQTHFAAYYTPDRVMSVCHACDECVDDTCVRSMTGCDLFLSDLYHNCQQETNLFGDILDALFYFCLFACCIAMCCDGCKPHLRRLASLGAQAGPAQPGPAQQHLVEERFGMRNVNGVGLGYLDLVGTYTELGQTLTTSYMLQVSPIGELSGTCTDADGCQQIAGKVCWPAGQGSGQIAWQETRPGVQTDALGTISGTQGAFHVEAGYVSTYGGQTQGRVSLRSRGPGSYASSEMMPLTAHMS